MFGSLLSGFLGSDAGSQAAGVANVGAQQGIDFLKEQLGNANRRLAPFFRAGRDAIPGLVEGTTAEGLDDRLARIFRTDSFNALRDERLRDVQGQLAAGGLTRSGAALEEIANVPTNLGLQIEQMLTGRLGGLVSGGQSAATNLGGFGLSAGSAIANMLGQMGQNSASGVLADEQAGAQAGSNLMNTALTVGSMFFSDPALKENVRPVGQIHDLTVYQWDWKPEFKDTPVMECGTYGFMADEVEEKYPQHIGRYGGFKCIDYPALLGTLEAA